MENTDHKPALLYVDDEEDNLFVFKAAFRRDYNIFTALSGSEGLEIFKKEKVAVIITDQRMPNMTGTQFLKELPDDIMTIRMIMTGYSDIEAVIDAINTGKIYKYITKPWDKEELKVTIDNALEALALRRKNIQLIGELKEANENLEQRVIERTAKVMRQKVELERKNKEITASITYAKRIQEAKLPNRQEIISDLPQSFILLKPKDIVSGDFYFFHKNNQSVLIAAADCTGHGVPGAFTSVICSEKLSDAVKYSNEPGEILALTSRGVKVSLKQAENDDSTTKDGMDIALCSVDLKTGIVRYAGANRPIWIIRNGSEEIEEIKATKQAIGGFTQDSQIFETHTIPLRPGDTFYIFSDGYADQNGGAEDKKLMNRKFKQILMDMQNKPMKEQGTYLDNYVTQWMGSAEQRDDILVIGVRI